MHRVIFQGDDSASYAAGRRNFVSGLQLPEHGLPFFLATLLGHDQDKIKDCEDENERPRADPTGRAARLQCD